MRGQLTRSQLAMGAAVLALATWNVRAAAQNTQGHDAGVHTHAEAAAIKNPVKATPESVTIGKERFQTFCVPCHGAEAKGGVTGPVAVKFVPPPDLTNAQLQAGRTDGYWHSYIMAGGAVMPSYGEAMSSEEAWHIVNFLRTVAAR